MVWSGSLKENSAIGASITYTPDSPESTPPASNWINVCSYAGNYSVSSFTAPKRGIYKFVLKGSGGAKLSIKDAQGTGDDYEGAGLVSGASGGTGGSTTGYLLLEAGQTVYVGAGGVCRAAFVSSAKGSSLSAIDKTKLYFVAGAGGSGGSWLDANNGTGFNCDSHVGGNGGGNTGKDGADYGDTYGGNGGTQSAAGTGGKASAGNSGEATNASGTTGSYGKGGNGGYANRGRYRGRGGRGGDGYYGGGGAGASAFDNGPTACGGGGGSGYVKNATLTVLRATYTSTTSQGGGASANKAGSVVVTYYARADLPVNFNGTTLDRIIFNGVDIQSLIFDGTKLYFERIKRRFCEWFTSTKAVRRSRAMI